MMSPRRLLSQTTSQLLVLAVLVAGSYSECPSGSVLHPGVGLCYWELTSLHNTSTAQRECQRQGGDLALVPLPDVEKFLIEHFDFLSYYHPDDCKKSYCVTRLVGYHVHRNDVASLSEPYLSLAWSPSLSDLHLVKGDCFRVRAETSKVFRWQHDSCGKTRRALCSSWADKMAAKWRGEAGRLGAHTLATSNQLTLSRCATSCHPRQGCASFNFQRSSGTCELVSKVKVHPGVTWSYDPSFKHYERQ